MKNLKLESDEGIIQQTTDVERYQANDKYTEIYEMYLTNKNLILVYEKSNGLFNTKDVIDKISLDNIKIVKGKVQIFKVDDDDYGLGMQIFFKDGSCEHFVFEKDKEIQQWLDSITEIVLEETKENSNNNSEIEVDKNVEISTKENEELTERKQVYVGEIKKCPSCGEVLKSFSAICPACGHELNNQKVNNHLKKFMEEIDNYEKIIVEDGNNVKWGWNSWNSGKKIGWIILNIVLFLTPLLIYYFYKLIFFAFNPKLSNTEKKLNTTIQNYQFPNDRESILSALIFMKEKVEYYSSENTNPKNYYWVKTWCNKAKTLKQKADLLFQKDDIVRRTYDSIIQNENIIKKKYLIRTAVIAILILLFFTMGYLKNNNGNISKKDYNTILELPSTGIIEEIPKLNFKYGNVTMETDTYINIDLYKVSKEEFGDYLKACREDGYDLEMSKTETYYNAKNTNGYHLTLYYTESDDTMSINLKKDENDEKNNQSNESKNESNTSVSFGDNIVANSNEYIEIKDVEYTRTEDFLTCIVTIKNINSKKAVNHPSFRVTVYDKEGKILGSEERVLNILYPNQEMVDQGTLIKVSGESAKIEVTMLKPLDVVSVSDLEHPVYKEMKCQNISVNSNKITGEVYNSNDYEIESAMITVVFRDSNNKIVYSEVGFVDNIPANGKVPFDISAASNVKLTDKIEVFAYIW